MCVKTSSSRSPTRTCASEVSEKNAAILGSKYEIAAAVASAARPIPASFRVSKVFATESDCAADEDATVQTSTRASLSLIKRLQAQGVPLCGFSTVGAGIRRANGP